MEKLLKLRRAYLSSTMEYWAGLFVLIFPFLVSNIRMRETLPGYDFLSLLRFIPRSFFYGLILGLLVVCYLRYGTTRKTLFSNYLIIATIYLSVVFFLLNPGDVVSTFQGIFYFFSPLLVFQIVRNLPSKALSLDSAVNFYLGFLVLNIPIALFLYFRYGLSNDFSTYNPFDAVSGLFAESHAFGIFIFLCMVLLLSRIQQTKELKYKILFGLALFIEFICYNEKLLVLLIGVLFIYFMVRFKGYVKLKVAMLLLTLVMGVQVYLIVQDRLGIVANYAFTELPVFESYGNAFDVYYNHPEYLVTGAGFGEYGTIMVQTKVKDGTFPELARDYNYNYIMRVVNPDVLSSSTLISLASSIQIGLNTVSAFMVEAGIILTILLLFFYFKILKSLWASRSIDKATAIIKKGLVIYFICMALYANVTIFGSFDDFVSTIPFVVIAALLLKEEKESRHLVVVEHET